MKKLIPFLMLVGVTSGFSQGQVNFANSPGQYSDGAVVDRFVYLGSVGGTKLSGTNWVAQLYAAPGTGLAESSLVPLTTAPAKFFASTVTSKLGSWSGGTRTIANCPEGQVCTIAIKVWDGSLFSSFDAAAAAGGMTGDSGTFTYVTPVSPILNPDTLQMYALRAFAVTPEPSAIALSVLGIAGLLLIRRRK